MKTNVFLGIALGTALSVAACGADPNTLGNGSGAGESRTDTAGNDADGTGTGGGTGTGTGSGTGTGTGTGSGGAGTLPTNSPEGKAYFTANVFPFLAQKCGSCHEAGPGSPNWTNKTDASKAYDLLYLNGYAVDNSRVIMKGAHSGGAAPELTSDEKTKFVTWIATEKKDGGTKAQTNVLETFGTCLDQAKFQAIGLQNLRTIRRQNGNNPTNQTENANNCTGCNNAACTTCHSGDEGSSFVMAIGNNVLPANYTFEETKKMSPPYLRQYFATTPAGAPVGSDGIQKKSDGTALGAAYSHPMFKLNTEQQTALKAFVDDAIAKYTAGTCGK